MLMHSGRGEEDREKEREREPGRQAEDVKIHMKRKRRD
jgi:hypothetical protein